MAAQLFDTGPVLLKSLIYFLLLSKSSQYPGNRQCRALALASPWTSASSVGRRALDAGGLGQSVYGLQPHIQSPAGLAVTNNPTFKTTGPEFCFLLHAGEFLVVNFSEAPSEAD